MNLSANLAAELNTFIDHTLLKNTATPADYDKLISEAVEHRFFSVCVPPHIAGYAHEKLLGSSVKTCSVAGFPLGYSTLQNKKNEISGLYKLGCDEVDVVLNVANVKAKNWAAVEEEFKVFSDFSKSNCLKVIIESGVLTSDEIISICKVAKKYPVSFLKTSTGFAEVSATLDAVKTIRANTPSEISIKASGGIRNQKQALEFIKAGANRLGCSASIAIVGGK